MLFCPLLCGPALLVSIQLSGCAGNVKSTLKMMEEQERFEKVLAPLNERLARANAILSQDTLFAMTEFAAIQARARVVADSLIQAKFYSPAGISQVNELGVHACWNAATVTYGRAEERYNRLAAGLREIQEMTSPPNSTAADDRRGVSEDTAGRVCERYAALQDEATLLAADLDAAIAANGSESMAEIRKKYSRLAEKVGALQLQADRRARGMEVTLVTRDLNRLIQRYNEATLLNDRVSQGSGASAGAGPSVRQYQRVEELAATIEEETSALSDSLESLPDADAGTQEMEADSLRRAATSLRVEAQALRRAARYNWIAASALELTRRLNQHRYTYDRDYARGVSLLQDVVTRSRALQALPELDPELQGQLRELVRAAEEAWGEAKRSGSPESEE